MSDLQNVAALTDQLSGSPEERVAAAEALAQLGTDCCSACIPLVRACGTDEMTREWATAALEEMGPPPTEVIPKLIELIADPTNGVAYWAITLLGRAQGQANQACETLATLIVSDRDISLRERAVWAVEKIGCQSQNVIESLTTASQSSHARLARLASNALP